MALRVVEWWPKVISAQGRANLLVSRDARQGVATFSEITFGKRYGIPDALLLETEVLSYGNSKSAGFTPGLNFPKPKLVGLNSPT